MAQTVIAYVACAGLLFSPLPVSATPPLSNVGPCETISSTISREEKYRRAAICFRAELDLSEMDLDKEREKSKTQAKLIDALGDLAEAERSKAPGVIAEIPTWLWPIGTLAIIAAFTGGLLLGRSDARRSP